jgi:hypothetical protein
MKYRALRSRAQEQAMNDDKREAQGDHLKIGQHLVAFDEAGAHIEHNFTRARYRVQTPTATNAVDFLKHHKRLIFAMMSNSPAELEAYRIQQHPEGGNK